VLDFSKKSFKIFWETKKSKYKVINSALKYLRLSKFGCQRMIIIFTEFIFHEGSSSRFHAKKKIVRYNYYLFWIVTIFVDDYWTQISTSGDIISYLYSIIFNE